MLRNNNRITDIYLTQWYHKQSAEILGSKTVFLLVLGCLCHGPGLLVGCNPFTTLVQFPFLEELQFLIRKPGQALVELQSLNFLCGVTFLELGQHVALIFLVLSSLGWILLFVIDILLAGILGSLFLCSWSSHWWWTERDHSNCPRFDLQNSIWWKPSSQIGWTERFRIYTGYRI